MPTKTMRTTLAIGALLLFGHAAFAVQIPTKFIQDSAVTAGKLSCGAAANTYVATCNGSGGVSYAAPAAGGTHIQEVPSGTINGSNTAFTLSQTPTANAVVLLFLDGLFWIQTVDYTISGTSVTATTAPATGQKLRAKYIY